MVGTGQVWVWFTNLPEGYQTIVVKILFAVIVVSIIGNHSSPQ